MYASQECPSSSFLWAQHGLLPWTSRSFSHRGDKKTKAATAGGRDVPIPQNLNKLKAHELLYLCSAIICSVLPPPSGGCGSTAGASLHKHIPLPREFLQGPFPTAGLCSPAVGSRQYPQWAQRTRGSSFSSMFPTFLTCSGLWCNNKNIIIKTITATTTTKPTTMLGLWGGCFFIWFCYLWGFGIELRWIGFWNFFSMGMGWLGDFMYFTGGITELWNFMWWVGLLIYCWSFGCCQFFILWPLVSLSSKNVCFDSPTWKPRANIGPYFLAGCYHSLGLKALTTTRWSFFCPSKLWKSVLSLGNPAYSSHNTTCAQNNALSLKHLYSEIRKCITLQLAAPKALCWSACKAW